jgi:hypothetical protein
LLRANNASNAAPCDTVLRHRPREAVEKEAVLRVGLGQPLLKNPDGQVVGDKLPGIHVLPGEVAERCVLRPHSAQQVARRDVGQPQDTRQTRRLRPLARAGRADEEDFHLLSRD